MVDHVFTVVLDATSIVMFDEVFAVYAQQYSCPKFDKNFTGCFSTPS